MSANAFLTPMKELARIVFSCQPTSAASEAAFSAAGINASKTRSRLLSAKVAMMAVIAANRLMTHSGSFVQNFVTWAQVSSSAAGDMLIDPQGSAKRQLIHEQVIREDLSDSECDE